MLASWKLNPVPVAVSSLFLFNWRGILSVQSSDEVLYQCDYFVPMQ